MDRFDLYRIPPRELAKPNVHLRLKNLTLWADLLPPKKDEDFAALYASSTLAAIRGVPVRVASIEHLLKMASAVIREIEALRSKYTRDLDCLGAAAVR